MKREYFSIITVVVFGLLLGFGVIITCNGGFVLNSANQLTVPPSTYLMMIVALFFIDVIAFLFMQLYFIHDRSNFSNCILGLAFFSCIIYLILTMVIVQQAITNETPVLRTHKTVAMHYFFRQFSFCFIISLALFANIQKRYILSVVSDKTIFLLSLGGIVCLPVISLSICNIPVTPDFTPVLIEESRTVWDERYVKSIIFTWSILLFLNISFNKTDNTIWNCISIIAFSAILYNTSILFFINGYPHLWYISRMTEMFSKLTIVAIFICHIFKILQSTKQLNDLDSMTKIFNRNYFFNKVDFLISSKGTIPFGILIIDIDHFKSVNDTWGHPAGDKVILTVVDILTKCIRSTDTLARIGGEEFGIIILNITPEEIQVLAERIRKNVEHLTGNTIRYDIPQKVTISIGAFLVKDHTLNASEIYNTADHALYKAKSSGRNNVIFANAENEYTT